MVPGSELVIGHKALSCACHSETKSNISSSNQVETRLCGNVVAVDISIFILLLILIC